MNELMTLNNETLTMSSREIAELVESRHDHVKRSIERLAKSGVIRLPPMEVSEKINNLGLPQRVSEYSFSGEQGKRDSIIVIAQLCPEFTARLVDRWQELEQRNMVDPVALLNDPLYLRSALSQFNEKVIELTPKANAYDRIATQS